MKRATCLLVAALAATAVQAQYYRWVDEQGKTYYGDRPPPGATGKAQPVRQGVPEADKSLPYAVRQSAAKYPVTLFVSADCGDLCQAGRDYLKSRGVPFAEKDAATPEGAQALEQLLETKSGGVPVLSVGPKHARGWHAEEWTRLLDAAGYPKAAKR